MYKHEEENFIPGRNTITVYRMIDMHRNSIVHLTKLQKWICKIFKIEPRPYYHYRGFIVLDDASELRLNSLIQTENELTYRIIEIYFPLNRVHIETVIPSPISYHGITKDSELIVIGQAVPEEFSNPK